MNAAVAQERWQGQIVNGKFPLLEWLGGSANTAVFRTELPGLTPQPAAIKLVRAENVNGAQQISRWKESAGLSHSHLLRIFDAGHCQVTGVQWIYCVTEYAEENLDEVLPIRALSTAEVGELLPPILETLSYLHAKKLVHGRIKPSNIFAITNQLKLSIDSVRSVDQVMKPNHVTAYDPPEGEFGALSIDSDIWSLGMTLVAVLEQRPLTWSKSAQVDPPVPKSVPVPYSLIARECLRINPGARCSLQRIRELINQAPPAPQVALAPAPKRKIAAPVLAAVAAAILILAFVARHWTQEQLAPTPPPQEQASETNSAPADTATPLATAPATQPAAAPVQPVTIAPKQPVAPTPKPPVAQMSKPSPDNLPDRANVTRDDTGADAVAERVLPNVPRSARLTIHGRVHVKVLVTVVANGDVSDASLASPGPSRYFARLALESSQKWKFKPVQTNGQSTAGHWLLEYKFGRTATDVTPIPVH